MSALPGLAWRSLANRRYSAGLSVLTIAISVMLLLGVERLRHEARAGFLRSVSGVDLIVGARAHPVQLLLYSVFHLGEATQNVSWASYRAIAGKGGSVVLAGLSEELADTMALTGFLNFFKTSANVAEGVGQLK